MRTACAASPKSCATARTASTSWRCCTTKRCARTASRRADMRHVVVTGGAGFIGSHLADAYLARGWRGTVVDNFSTGVRTNVNAGANVIEGDLTDAKTIDAIVALKPDVINHHAAQIDVRQSVSDPA